MKFLDVNDFKEGWLIGDFDPSIIKTDKFEFAIKKHKKGEMVKPHYHKKTKELTFLINGCVKLNNRIINGGDIFLIEPFEIVSGEILKDSLMVVIRNGSFSNDKYLVI